MTVKCQSYHRIPFLGLVRRGIAPERKHRPFAGDERNRRGSSVWWRRFRRDRSYWDSQRSRILRSDRHEGVKWQTTRPSSNELSRYELMISVEPMNPGIATECKFVSATDVRHTSQLLVELAPLPRGSGASGVSNLRAPGS